MYLHIFKNSFKKILTFNVSYKDINYDEHKYAKEISNILGTDHETLEVDGKMIEQNIESIPDIYGEPFAD